METNKSNDKNSFNKSNSIIRDKKKKLSHIDSYKEQYLDKDNKLPLSSTYKKPILNLNENNNDSINDIKMNKPIQRRNKKNKSISFAKNVKFNNSKTINDTDSNSLNSSTSEKKNVYVNDDVKEQIIQKALIRHNSSKSDLVIKDKEIDIESDKENEEKYDNKEKEKIQNALLKKNQIKKEDLNKNEINNNENTSKIGSQIKEEENNEKIITITKDNFPYRKYEVKNSRNDLDNLDKSLSHKKSFFENEDEDENENNKKLTIDDLKSSLNNNKSFKKYVKSKTINITDNNLNKSFLSTNSNKNSVRIKKFNKKQFLRSQTVRIPTKIELEKEKEEFFKNRRARLILEKINYPSNSQIEKSDIPESISSNIPDLIPDSNEFKSPKNNQNNLNTFQTTSTKNTKNTPNDYHGDNKIIFSDSYDFNKTIKKNLLNNLNKEKNKDKSSKNKNENYNNDDFKNKY